MKSKIFEMLKSLPEVVAMGVDFFNLELHTDEGIITFLVKERGPNLQLVCNTIEKMYMELGSDVACGYSTNIVSDGFDFYYRKGVDW